VRTVLAREREVHRLLTRERVLGLDLIKGIKTVAAPEPAETDTGEPGGLADDDPPPSGAAASAETRSTPSVAAPPSADAPPAEADPSDDPGETRGLPLFSPESP
jgi:hypothetical protein